jgi:hypothetical protein
MTFSQSFFTSTKGSSAMVFHLVFRPKFSTHFWYVLCTIYPSQHTLLILISWVILLESTNYLAPHYTISLQTPLTSSYNQIFSSVIYFPNTLNLHISYMWVTKSHTHLQQEVRLQCSYFHLPTLRRKYAFLSLSVRFDWNCGLFKTFNFGGPEVRGRFYSSFPVS